MDKKNGNFGYQTSRGGNHREVISRTNQIQGINRQRSNRHNHPTLGQAYKNLKNNRAFQRVKSGDMYVK